jgi:hypothetical protein
MRKVRLLLMISLVVQVSTAWGGDNAINATILPGKIHEVCAKANVGDLIKWKFTSSSTVDFNVHHHRAKTVIMPVDKKAVLSDEGSQRVDQTNEWCLMWTATSGPQLSPTKVSGQWDLLKASQSEK